MSRGTLDPAGSALASDTGLSPSLAGCSKAVLLPLLNPSCSPNPAMHASRFGLFRVRSPLLTIKENKKGSQRYKDILEATGSNMVPEWLDVDAENLKGSVKELPAREAIDVPVDEMLIVELYSK